MKWGQRPGIYEENVLLKLLKDTIRQNFFTEGFLKELAGELNEALNK